MGNLKPVRSEVWLIDFGIAAKVRPALVVSETYGDEDRALIAVVPHTTSIRGSQYEIQIFDFFLSHRVNLCPVSLTLHFRPLF